MPQIPEDSPILHTLAYMAVDFILAFIGIGFTLGLGIAVLNGTIGVPISRKVTTEAISAVAFLGACPFVSRRWSIKSLEKFASTLFVSFLAFGSLTTVILLLMGGVKSKSVLADIVLLFITGCSYTTAIADFYYSQ